MSARATAVELAVFWEAREHPPRAYAEELFQLCRALAVTDVRLSRWHETSDELPGLVDSPDDIEAALAKHPSEWEHGGTRYHAFSTHLSSVAEPGGRVTIEAVVGIRERSRGLFWPNRVVLKFWGPDAVGGFTDERLPITWLDSLVVLFDPIWGAAGPQGFIRRDYEDLAFGKPIVSWMVFLSSAYGKVSAPPEPATVEPLRDGHLLVSTPGWYSPSLPEHAAASRQLKGWMDAQELRPLAVVLE